MCLCRYAPLLAGVLLAPGPCRVGVMTAPDVPAGADPVEFQRITRVYYSGIEESRRAVIRSDLAWPGFWVELQGSLRPQPPVPSIDFSRDLVIAAAMGQRSSGGYSIEIREVAADEGKLFAVVVEVSPGANCFVTAALTQPVDVVRVPGMAGRDVAFVERKETHDCG